MKITLATTIDFLILLTAFALGLCSGSLLFFILAMIIAITAIAVLHIAMAILIEILQWLM